MFNRLMILIPCVLALLHNESMSAGKKSAGQSLFDDEPLRIKTVKKLHTKNVRQRRLKNYGGNLSERMALMQHCTNVIIQNSAKLHHAFNYTRRTSIRTIGSLAEQYGEDNEILKNYLSEGYANNRIVAADWDNNTLYGMVDYDEENNDIFGYCCCNDYNHETGGLLLIKVIIDHYKLDHCTAEEDVDDDELVMALSALGFKPDSDDPHYHVPMIWQWHRAGTVQNNTQQA